MRIAIALQTGVANAMLVREATCLHALRKQPTSDAVQDDIDFILNSTYVNNGAIGPTRKLY